ncbi:MAG: YkgJ family cysteine cluster protein [Candidatus Anstonellales archaeon]
MMALKFNTYPCKFCDARCCKDYVITISSFDILKIVETLKIERKDYNRYFVLEEASILNKDESTVIFAYDDDKKLYEFVLALKSQPCVFLQKDNKCSIYAVAPLVCKLYPFRYNGKFLKSARCTLFSKTLFYVMKNQSEIDSIANTFSENLDKYRYIIRKWNSNPGLKSEFFDFVIMESKRFI